MKIDMFSIELIIDRIRLHLQMIILSIKQRVQYVSLTRLSHHINRTINLFANAKASWRIDEKESRATPHWKH
jgi:hypothetical protein